MLPYGNSRISKAVLIVFFLVLAGYGYYELRGILFGPRIEISTSAEEVHEPYIMVSGRAEHISSLSMNGHPISVTEDGYFDEPYLLSEGLNRILLDAEDTYGQQRQEVFEVVYTPLASSDAPPTAATSTPSTASSTPIAPQNQ